MATEKDLVPTSSDDADHLQGLARQPTITPLPEPLRTTGGIVVDVYEKGTASQYKLAKDGHTVLLPQPTDDPNDPLNWSWTKKHMILLAAAWAAFSCDYVVTYGPALIFPQTQEWDIRVFVANQPNSITILAACLGGLVWVPMSSYFGRAPVLLWTAVIGGAFSCGAAAAQSYATYFVTRVLSGFFLTAGQTMSVALLKDMFFFHERARKIGLWAMLYIASPYFGPQFSNFILHGTHEWRDAAWVANATILVDIILILLVVDETWYSREKHSYEQPARPAGILSRLERLVGIWQIRHHRAYFPKVMPIIRSFFMLILEPAFALICLNYLMNFMWAIGINLSASILFRLQDDYGGYGYSARQLGYLYFTPIVAIFLGEVFGHFFNDMTVKRYVHRHNGIFEPEVRLRTIYIALVLMAAGLILVGQALYRHLSVAAVIFGWGMHSFGLLCMSVANVAYGMDAYPHMPAEVGGWLNAARTLGGFSVGYFQSDWASSVGYDASFGTQGAIVVASVVPVVIVQIYGRRMRTGKSRV